MCFYLIIQFKIIFLNIKKKNILIVIKTLKLTSVAYLSHNSIKKFE